MAGNAKGKSPSSALAYATTLQYVVEVSFNSDQPPAFPWNDLNGGTSIKQMVTTDGLNSFANLSLVKNFTGTNTLGATTYSNSGIYPDNVLRGQYYTLSPDSAVIRLNGLLLTSQYNLTFLSSWINPWAPAVTSFRIEKQPVTS